MIIFYSGHGSKNMFAENIINGNDVGFMMTYSDLHNKKSGDIQRFKDYRKRIRRSKNEK